MSSVSNGGWQPPSAPPSPAASLGWRIRHSLWLLLPVAGCGFLAGAGFLYVGLRARRPAWWIAGIVYLVIGWTSFATVGEADKTSTLSTVAAVVLMALWVASIVHGFVINSSWLRWRAGHVPWYARPQAPPPTWPGSQHPPAQAGPPSLPTSVPPAVAEMMPQPGAYSGNGTTAAPVPSQPSPLPAPQPPSAPMAVPPGPWMSTRQRSNSLPLLPTLTRSVRSGWWPNGRCAAGSAAWRSSRPSRTSRRTSSLISETC